MTSPVEGLLETALVRVSKGWELDADEAKALAADRASLEADLATLRDTAGRYAKALQEKTYQQLAAVWAGEAKLQEAGAILAIVSMVEEIAAGSPGESGDGIRQVAEQARAEVGLLLGKFAATPGTATTECEACGDTGTIGDAGAGTYADGSTAEPCPSCAPATPVGKGAP